MPKGAINGVDRAHGTNSGARRASGRTREFMGGGAVVGAIAGARFRRRSRALSQVPIRGTVKSAGWNGPILRVAFRVAFKVDRALRVRASGRSGHGGTAGSGGNSIRSRANITGRGRGNIAVPHERKRRGRNRRP